MASDPRDTIVCPVLFFGVPTLSAGFDSFAEAAEKSGSIRAQRFIKLDMASEKVNEIDHGVVFLLLSGKNDLLTILNYLPSIKKRIDQGVLRVMVYSMLDHDKIPHLLKSKGCSETLTDKLTQKALGHKLQKSIQIVMAKWQTKKKDKIDDVVSFKGGAKPKSKAGDDELGELDLQAPAKGRDPGKADLSAAGAPAASSKPASTGKARIEFVPALESENDCWLLKSKKDFKFVRGYWMGEMIGPGPSAGSWVEAAGPKTKTAATYVWTPRGNPPDPFVPGGGKWIFYGRKPEFIWKTNRWRFISEKPTLYYQPEASSPIKLYRFNAAEQSVFELALNSESAKSKIQAIIKTVTVDRRFTEEKKTEGQSNDLELEAESAEGGAWTEAFARGEDAAGWGDLEKDDSEDELPDWNDAVSEDDEPGVDWGGLDTGRGNKFNSGRGLGQGQGDGNKGYKHEEETFTKGESGGLGWKQGAAAFDKIKLDISLKRDGSTIQGVMLLERNDTELTLDAPAGAYQVGEKMNFDVMLGKEGSSKMLQVAGVLLSTEPMEDGTREMIQIKVEEASRFHLAEIQKVFEQRQEQLLQFLREAKGG